MLVTLRRKQGLEHQAERLGAFVNSVCNNVFLEYLESAPEASLDDQGNPLDPPILAENAEESSGSEDTRRSLSRSWLNSPQRRTNPAHGLIDERDKAKVSKSCM